MRSRATILYALAIFIAGTMAEAQAQAASSASPSPAASASAAPAVPANTQDVPVSKPLSAAPRAHSFYPIIDIAPEATFQGIGGVAPAPVGSSIGIKQPVDIGGTVTIPLGSVFSVAFDRLVGGTLNTGPERTTNAKNQYTYPAYSQDVVLVYRADARLHQFLIESGFVFRHRECCPASADPNNPSSTEAHYGYLGFTYNTPGIKALHGANFALNITGQLANHKKSALAAPSPLDIGDTQEHTTSQYVAFNYPFDRRRSFVASVREAWGAMNWYENAPFPYQWAGQTTYLVTKKYNSVFSLSMSYIDKHQRKQGAPYVFPNAQHQEAWFVTANFHLDTASFFR